MNISSKIGFSCGDLADSDADAIVNAANNDLLLGGGVAGAIRIKGGPVIQKECDAIGSIPVGFAAITSGGNLKARYVIHAASMQLGGHTTAAALRSSTAHCLRIAAEKKLKSIAFPAVGAGIAGFPLLECAKIMLGECVKHLKGTTSLEQIHFVLFDQAALDAFKIVWKDMHEDGTLEEGDC
ncbi:MAG: macro domain-containing protein [Acidobacteria bacterium]|nr:macro domain-containing protein [Acidobacteriota bacterium]MCL5287298.1 macro domain-containing protein [Acidobacteriota bacterium]